MKSLVKNVQFDEGLFDLSDEYRTSVLLQECRALMGSQRSGFSPIRTAHTELEYDKRARLLLGRAETDPRFRDDLAVVIGETTRPSTFHGRTAALKFYLSHRVSYVELAYQMEVEHREGGFSFEWMSSLLEETLKRLIQVHAAVEMGFTGRRTAKKSKQKALKGLAPDWREQMCIRASGGRYAVAFPVAVLTGCRPAELATIEVMIEHDAVFNGGVLRLKIWGAKVGDRQGQLFRILDYPVDSSSPVVARLVAEVRARREGRFTVDIESGENFSAEVRRLGGALWPKHHSGLSAICFRHQFSADLKKCKDSAFASAALGHQSALTKRHYAKAGQSRSNLVPLRVEVPSEIRHIRTAEPPSKRRDNGVEMEPA